MHESEAVRPERLDVRGLPVFWAEGPTFAAALIFRVGWADETLPTLGLTHLVEHLALFPVGRTAFPANGVVEDLYTIFYATGTPAEALGYLEAAAANLGDLPLDRLEVEKRVLETESASRNAGWRDRMLDLRYGPAGFGLVSYQEYGLKTATGEQVAAWARERFVRGNAAVWMTGPPPDGFDLPLAEGARAPAPTLVPLPRLTLPAHLVQPDSGVMAAFTGERTRALSTGVRVALWRAEERLRREQGMSYAVVGTYEPLAAETMHAVVRADCLEEHANAVQEELLAILRALAADGPDEAELARDLDERARAVHEPASAAAWSDLAARDELVGADVEAPADTLAEARKLTPSDVAVALDACLGTMIVAAPQGATRPEGVVEYEVRSPAPVHGREFRDGARRRPTRVVAGTEGVTLHAPDDPEPATVRFDETAALLRWSDHRITLIALDGGWIELAGLQLQNGAELIRLVRARVPDELVVPMEDVPRHEVLVDLAFEKLGGIAAWTQFEALPERLEPGERVLNLAQLNRPSGRRLLALTDRRLLWLGRTRLTKRDVSDAVDLADVEQVSIDRGPARLLGRVTVRFRDGTRLRLGRFARRERASEFYDALAALADAS